MTTMHHPRSTLHALTPMGLDTPGVESLSSYVCRLAHSHGMTSQKLVDWVLAHFEHTVCEKYGWHQRNLSSMSAESEQWAAWLSELTGVPALDRLTLAPYRHLLGTPGLAPRSDRWCSCCFAEDKQRGEVPYLRLAWDIAPVEACLRHKVYLTSVCPHCQRSNVRNRAAIVVPGYCTACGGFLGDGVTESAIPESLWMARQVGKMLAHRPQVGTEGVVPLLETVIACMAEGKIATFASRYGFSKSGVWHWLRKGGLPGIKAWLTIALHGGIGLDQLFAGEVENWEMPHQPLQLSIALPESPRAGIQSRELDWEGIRASLREMLALPTPISINEAGERVGVGRKHLYLRANAEARAVADRHRRHRAATKQQRDDQLRAKIEALLDERLAAGYEGISARDIWAQLDAEAQSVCGIFNHISAVLSSRYC
ncbi:TniQ family protein [Chromobacterium phragmitis]|uniref:TetR family transcriptional regulator n=1 Tax=Chromobacterium phragmitis TaxID=2202141 RepID=A0A344UHA6_9NEIS|nr:TniQ family protein [Chromobacterium phragmitis]AXE34654.1 TetR family transcriptional regulator [Chromobacterium phragmitis]